jgi:hypothetical protein
MGDNILLEDKFTVTGINKEGKYFKKGKIN